MPSGSAGSQQQSIPSSAQFISVRHTPSLPQISAAVPLHRVSVGSQTGVGHPTARNKIRTDNNLITTSQLKWTTHFTRPAPLRERIVWPTSRQWSVVEGTVALDVPWPAFDAETMTT